MVTELQDGFRIGEFEVFPRQSRISGSGSSVRVQPKIVDVLLCLAEADGEVQSRQQLHDQVWGDVVVTDDALNRCISELRRVFGDKRGAVQYIETVPKRGYRLLKAIDPLDASLHHKTDENTPERPPAPNTAVATIAVLPFENLTPDSPNAFLADAIPTALHCGLARLNRIRVSSRRASFGLAESEASTQDIGKQLGVQYVVSGTIAEASNRLRVIAEVDDADAGILLWSQRYEVAGRNVLDLEEQLTDAVVGAFGGQRLRAEIGRAQEGQAASLDSWGLVQRARAYLFRYEPDSLRDAKELLTEAITRDPDYALGQAMYALIIAEITINALSDDPAGDIAIARQSADKALKLAPNDPAVLRTCGCALAFCGDYRNSLKTLRHAVSIAPFDFGAWGYMGWPLAASGRKADLEELLDITKRLLETAPSHPGAPYWHYHRSVAQDCLADNESAIGSIESCLEEQPDFALGLMHYADLLGDLDRNEEAAAATDKATAANESLTPERYVTIVNQLTDQEIVRQQRLDGLHHAGLLD